MTCMIINEGTMLVQIWVTLAQDRGGCVGRVLPFFLVVNLGRFHVVLKKGNCALSACSSWLGVLGFKYAMTMKPQTLGSLTLRAFWAASMFYLRS